MVVWFFPLRVQVSLHLHYHHVQSLVLWPLLFSTETGTNHFITHPNTWRLRTAVINAGSDFSPVIASPVPGGMLFTRHMEKMGL